MSDVVGVELRAKLDNPLKFQGIALGAGISPAVTYGFDVALLIDLANAIIAAESKVGLPKRYEKIGQQVHIIVGASAKSGIKYLVYSLAGGSG